MAPSYTEVSCLEEVAASFFSDLVIGVCQREVTVAFVVHLISRVDIYCPRSQGVDISCQCYVEIITYDEIHSEIPKVESSGAFFSKCREEDTRGSVRTFRDESEGKTYRQWDIGYDRICRAEHCLLGRLGHDLGSRQMEVIMRLLTVTYGVFSMCDVDGAVGHHLDVLAVEDSVLLLCHHVGYACLLGVEVVADLIHAVGFTSLFHHRLSDCRTCRIRSSAGIQDTCLEVIFHIVGRHLHVAVGDGDISIIVDLLLAVAEILYDGVSCGGESWRI